MYLHCTLINTEVKICTSHSFPWPYMYTAITDTQHQHTLNQLGAILTRTYLNCNRSNIRHNVYIHV